MGKTLIPCHSYHFPPHLGDGNLLPQEELGGHRPQGDDDLGGDELNLLEEPLVRADLGLVGQGGAVLRGAALDDVGDVDLFPLDSRRLQDAV